MDTDELSAKLYRYETGPLTNIVFQIQRVRLRSYVIEMGGLPVGPTESLAKQLDEFGENLKTRFEDPAEEMKTIRFFLSKGVVQPKIWIGDPSECPQGEIPLDALGGDADWLAGRVAEFSFGFEETRSYDRFFPERERNDAGLGGKEVREDPVGADGAGDGQPVVQPERGPEGHDGGDRGESEGQATEGEDQLTQ